MLVGGCDVNSGGSDDLENVDLGVPHYCSACGALDACLNGVWAGEELGVVVVRVVHAPLELHEVAGQCFGAAAAAYASCWQVGNLVQLPD